MRLVALPGVYRPRSDTALLRSMVRDRCGRLDGRRSLDLCTGTGAVALAAAAAGAEAWAVDSSRRAAIVARVNAKLNGLNVRVRHGDLWAAVGQEEFDLVTANPPYLPCAEPRTRGAARAWDAGRDGRAVLDPLCEGATRHLRPGGRMLLVQSSLAGVGATLAALRATGLGAEIVAEVPGPLGPLARSRADWLIAEGRVGEELEERLVVVEARQPMRGSASVTYSAESPVFSTTE